MDFRLLIELLVILLMIAVPTIAIIIIARLDKAESQCYLLGKRGRLGR